MEVLHEIQLRLTEVEYDHPVQAQLCEELVEKNFLGEVVSTVREFRFHIGLQSRKLQQICVRTKKAKQRKTTFVEAVAAELALKHKHHPLSGAPAVVPPHSAHRFRQLKAATEFDGGRTERQDTVRSTERGGDEGDLCGLAEGSRFPSRSGSRLRRALAAKADPPVLSAISNLHFVKVNDADSGMITTSADTAPPTNKSGRLDLNFPLSHLRPMSSPARSTSSCLQLGSSALAVAVYASAPLFVEPSPLSERMANRGVSSAGGTRRRVGFKKRPPVQIPTQVVVIESFDEPENQSSSEPVENNATKPASTFASNPTNDSDDSFANKSAGNCDDSDDAHEDDFVSLDDNKPGTSQMNDEFKLESDTELIDLLHDIPLQDSNDADIKSKIHGIAAQNGPLPEHETARVREIETSAATCIQRHVQGHAARRWRKSREMCCSNVEFIPEPNPSTCKPERRSTKTHQTKSQGEVHRIDRLFGKLTKTQQVQIKLGRDIGKEPGWISAAGGYGGTVHSKMSKSIPRSATNSDARYATLAATSQNRISNSARSKKPRSAPATSLRTIEHAKSPLSLKRGASSERNQDVDEVTCDPIRRIQVLYSQGLLYQKENKLELAIDSYEAATRIPASGREFASLYINLGSAQMAQLRFGDALDSFQNAERIHPTNVKAVYNSALASMHLGMQPKPKNRCVDAMRWGRGFSARGGPANAKNRKRGGWNLAWIHYDQ